MSVKTEKRKACDPFSHAQWVLNKNQALDRSGELAQERECGWELGSLVCRRGGSYGVLRRMQVQTGLLRGRGGGVFPGP